MLDLQFQCTHGLLVSCQELESTLGAMISNMLSIEQFAIEGKEIELQHLKTTILQQSNCNYL